MNPSTCACAPFRNNPSSSMNPLWCGACSYASRTRSSARLGSRSKYPMSDCVDRTAALALPSPDLPNSASAVMSFEYPSLSSRSRLNLFWVYTSRVLMRTSFFFHPTDDGMRPHSSRNSPSHRSTRSSRVSKGSPPPPSPSHSVLASSTSLERMSGSISVSKEASQMQSAMLDDAVAWSLKAPRIAGATSPGSSSSRSTHQQSSARNLRAFFASTPVTACRVREEGKGGSGSGSAMNICRLGLVGSRGGSDGRGSMGELLKVDAPCRP